MGKEYRPLGNSYYGPARKPRSQWLLVTLVIAVVLAVMVTVQYWIATHF